MARYASLFPTAEDAEQAVEALKESTMHEDVRAQIVSEEDWKASWGESDQKRPAPEGPLMRDPEHYLDIWMNQETAAQFARGLERGGAVLVIDVPDDLAKQALKILKENRGKFA